MRTTKETLTKETLTKGKSNGITVTGKEFNNLIFLFEPINPNFERIYSNKTQRSALERMVKKHGIEKVTKVIQALPEVINKPYSPRITTPYVLEQKLGDLIAFMKQERSKQGESNIHTPTYD